MDKYQEEAFLSKIDKAERGCWNWLGAKDSKGYGRMRLNKKYTSTHRAMWELCNFKIPDGYIIMHLCDNPSCVRPDHLVLGSMKANTFDMMNKGRDGFQKNRAIGDRNINSKLNPEAVREIRRLSAGGLSQRAIAEKYSVAQTCISSILRGKTWGHVK